MQLAGSIAYANQAFRWGASAYGLQFHVEVRSGDLRQWKQVPGYVRLLEGAGTTWDALSDELGAAAPVLDQTMRALIERWLMLVSAAAAMRSRTQIAA